MELSLQGNVSSLDAQASEGYHGEGDVFEGDGYCTRSGDAAILDEGIASTGYVWIT